MDTFKDAIITELKKITGLDEIPLEIPPNQELGDYAFPCFVLSKQMKKSPHDIAKDLSEKISIEGVTKINVEGPYLNFFVNKASLGESVLTSISQKKEDYGRFDSTNQKKMVEFFHANTHKGVHIGHIRNISLGEALCRILEFNGDDVLRVNYQGDIGPHVAKCIWGYQHSKEDAPETHKGVWLGKKYAEGSAAAKNDEKAAEQIQLINENIYNKDPQTTEVWKKTRQWCLDDFNSFYKTYNVKFDDFFFESETEAEGKKIALELLEKGIAIKDDGAIIVDLKPYKLGVCVILTSKGYPLYQTKELGLASAKLAKYSVDKSIHVVGMEQELYFKQMFKIFELMESPLAGKSHHLSYGLVMLPEGKMSSRDGTMILYADLIEELTKLATSEIIKRHEDWDDKKVSTTALQIALGALKFSMVNRETHNNIIFDKSKAIDFEGETGPYIQYVHARICSLLKKAGSLPSKVDFSLLKEKEEHKLITLLSQFPAVVQEAASHCRPHLVSRYVLDLAQTFNEFYHAHSVLKAEESVKNARLYLVSCVRQVVKNALYLINIDAPDEM